MTIGAPLTVQQFALPFDQVFDGLVGVLAANGFSIDAQDRAGGTISAGAQAAAPGETLAIQVKRANDRLTAVVVTSSGVAGPASAEPTPHTGKRILSELSARLQPGAVSPTAAAAANFVAGDAPTSRLRVAVFVGLGIIALLGIVLSVWR
jgi:hypothetical protein